HIAIKAHSAEQQQDADRAAGQSQCDACGKRHPHEAEPCKRPEQEGQCTDHPVAPSGSTNCFLIARLAVARVSAHNANSVSAHAMQWRASSRVLGKYARTWSRSCITAMIVRCSPCHDLISWISSAVVSSSTAANGSSSKMSEASWTTRRANNALRN